MTLGWQVILAPFTLSTLWWHQPGCSHTSAETLLYFGQCIFTRRMSSLHSRCCTSDLLTTAFFFVIRRYICILQFKKCELMHWVTLTCIWYGCMVPVFSHMTLSGFSGHPARAHWYDCKKALTHISFEHSIKYPPSPQVSPALKSSWSA